MSVMRSLSAVLLYSSLSMLLPLTSTSSIIPHGTTARTPVVAAAHRSRSRLQASCQDSTILAQCAASSQTCAVEADTGDQFCDQCLDGYIDLLGNRPFSGRKDCVWIDDILNLQTFRRYFEPRYNDPVPEAERLVSLVTLARFISSHNAAFPPPDYFLSINAFSADTEEDARQRTGYRYDPNEEDVFAVQPADGRLVRLPERVNWVERSAVTSVKDQGRCGCCWAVSLCGSLEGIAAINSNFTYLQSQSFQQMISCSDANSGCGGGNIVVGMVYALDNRFGGMSILNDYPFSDEGGTTTEDCRLGPATPLSVISDDAQLVVTYQQEDLSHGERVERMKATLARQPISVVMKATCKTISSYGSGVLTDDGDCACSSINCIDHAVLLVGYDDTSNPPFWLVKNSWGTGWGEEGYFRVSQQEVSDSPWGLFGLMAQGVVPLTGQNITAQEDDKDQTVVDVTWWAWLLIVVAGMFVVGLGGHCIGRTILKRQRTKTLGGKNAATTGQIDQPMPEEANGETNGPSQVTEQASF